MTSNRGPFSFAAKSSSACLPAGFTESLAKSNSESAEKLTRWRMGGGGGGGGAGGGGGGGDGSATGATMGAGAGGGVSARPNLNTSPAEYRSTSPLLPTASSTL